MKKRKQKEGGWGLLSQKISNRLSYTIIAFVGLMLAGVFVFAIAPNPGHDYHDLDLYPITIKDSTHLFNVEIDGGLEAEMFKAAVYCMGEDCITSWPLGGSGGTPTLAQVLAAGADADRMIDMNSHDIADVNTLNLVNAGKISADDGQVDVQGKLHVGTGLSVGGNINTLGSITPGSGISMNGKSISMTDGSITDANTVQANTLEDPEDDKVTVNDNLIVNGYIGGPKIGVVTTLGTSTCSSNWRNLVDLTYYTVDPAYCVAVLQECQTHADSEPEDCACRISGNYLQVLNNEDGCDDYVYTKCAAICGII